MSTYFNKNTLLSFVIGVHPHSYRFMQDNDPKHTSKLDCRFLLRNKITWWKTSPESPAIKIYGMSWRIV